MGSIGRASGFTIIETMLVLAVTAALAIGVLVGTGSAINQQRYQDAVNSLKSYLQDQYSRVATVTNDRTNGYTCDSSAQITASPSGQARGASDCIILGRMVTVDATGQHLTSSSVVGYRPVGTAQQTTDFAELSSYTMGIPPSTVLAIDGDNQDVAWGATIIKPKSNPGSPEPLTILIVRSPLSGRILTFTRTGVVSDPNAVLKGGSSTSGALMCLSAGSTGVGQQLGVQIDPTAAGQSAVEIPLGSSGVCG